MNITTTNVRHVRAALQRGFSLIELMVSMAIGMVLILFVSSLFLTSKSSSRLQEEMGRMQEDGRAAMALVARNIKQAWYGEPISFSVEGVRTDFLGQGLVGCDKGFTNPSTLTDASCSASGTLPAFQVSYRVENVANQALGIGTDCNGQLAGQDAAGNSFVVNRFYLKKPANEPNLALYCAGSGGAVAQPILSNVENMVVTYGIDTDNDKGVDFSTTSAATALAKTPASPGFPSRGYPAYKGVVSVGVCLQIVSSSTVTEVKQTYTDCNGTVTTATDNRLRLIMSNVYTIRNNSGTTLVATP